MDSLLINLLIKFRQTGGGTGEVRGGLLLAVKTAANVASRLVEPGLHQLLPVPIFATKVNENGKILRQLGIFQKILNFDRLR